MALFKGKLFGGKLFSTLIFGYSVEVIITPVKDTGGGWSAGIPDVTEYLVTIRITRKKKKWEQSYTTTNFEAKSLIKVLASFKMATAAINNVAISITRPLLRINNLIVTAFKVKEK